MRFPGGLVVKTLHFQGRGHGFDPLVWEVLHAAQCDQKKTQNKQI